MVRSASLATLSLALLSACGPSAPPPDVPPTPTESPAATTAPTAGPTSTPADATAAPASTATPADAKGAKAAEPPASEAATLARDLLKSGGRRIGWSASKKMFVHPVERRVPNGFSLDLQFTGEDGQQRDLQRVCQPGECAEELDEIAKELLPKLTSRFESEGYVAIRGIGWPQGRDELDVSSLDLKLVYSKGRLEGRREGKPAVVFSPVGRRLDTPTLQAIFVVPDSKLVAVSATPAKEGGPVQELFLLKRP